MNRGYIYGILGALSFALITSIGKLALIEASVQDILFIRFLIVIAIILGYCLITSQFKKLLIKRKDILLLMAVTMAARG